MQLHRSAGKPDWTDVPDKERNNWQRWAARTGGALTPGNVCTLLGLTAVGLGLVLLGQHHYWAGLLALVLGRLCDVVDGWLAEVTGTKSPLGEALDVIADKLAVLGSIGVFFALHITPSWLLAVMLLPHAIITVLTVVAYLGRYPLHPSLVGKYAMAAVWAVLAGFIVVRAAHGAGWTRDILEVVGVVTAAAGLYAAFEYARGRD